MSERLCGSCNAVNVHAEEGECEVCGQWGDIVAGFGDSMCGPCTWGEAACLDPAEWEGVYHEDGCTEQKAAP